MAAPEEFYTFVLGHDVSKSLHAIKEKPVEDDTLATCPVCQEKMLDKLLRFHIQSHINPTLGYIRGESDGTSGYSSCFLNSTKVEVVDPLLKKEEVISPISQKKEDGLFDENIPLSILATKLRCKKVQKIEKKEIENINEVPLGNGIEDINIDRVPLEEISGSDPNIETNFMITLPELAQPVSPNAFMETSEENDMSEILCEKCGESCKGLEDYEKHCRYHQNEYLTCKTCYKSFRLRLQYVNHMKGHLYKKYICGTCNRLYRQEDVFKRHEASHLKPYKCPYCVKAYATVSSLCRHRRDRHPDTKGFKKVKHRIEIMP